MVIGRRKLLRNCSKSTSVLQFREENVARILLATSALLSTDSFIWLFHDKVYRQDVITISLLECRGYRNIPYYFKCIRTCEKNQSSYSVHEYKFFKEIRNTLTVIKRPNNFLLLFKVKRYLTLSGSELSY